MNYPYIRPKIFFGIRREIDDEIHVPIANNWHNDAVLALAHLAATKKKVDADRLKQAVAVSYEKSSGRWTISKRQAAKFLLWASKKPYLVEGRWKHYFSDTASSSRLNEDAIYSYKAPKFDMKKFIGQLFKRIYRR